MALPNMQSSCRAHVKYFPKDSCCILRVPHIENIPEEKNLVETDRVNMHMVTNMMKYCRKAQHNFETLCINNPMS